MKVPEGLSSLMPSVKQMVLDVLPQNLLYHNYEHTHQVVDFALRLAEMAHLTAQEVKLLYAAAVLHDCGYSTKYLANEDVAAKLAAKILPAYGFTADEIAQIANLILATNLVVAPKSYLEMLLCDADMGYLAGDDFLEWSNKLCQEWKSVGVYNEPSENWLASQIEFLQKHKYYTKEAIALFDAGKQNNMNQLKTLKTWPY